MSTKTPRGYAEKRRGRSWQQLVIKGVEVINEKDIKVIMPN